LEILAFGGMLTASFIGIFAIPVLYMIISRFAKGCAGLPDLLFGRPRRSACRSIIRRRCNVEEAMAGRSASAVSALMVLAALAAGNARAAVTEDSFLLRNTGDFVDLCSAEQSDRLYTAARNFCEGFAVGVYRVLEEQDMARQSGHMFCVLNPAPTRDQGIANFVQWAKADPKRLQLSAPDGIAMYLSTQYPCQRGH
jgi:hypothetical protein